jgi:hypothetical protein
MPDVHEDSGWGSWVLGDLADTLLRLAQVLGQAAGLLGRSSDVVRVSVAPPPTPADLPRVTVVAPTEFAVRRLRSNAVAGEFGLHWVGTPQRSHWVAEVVGVRLAVTVAEDQL